MLGVLRGEWGVGGGEKRERGKERERERVAGGDGGEIDIEFTEENIFYIVEQTGKKKKGSVRRGKRNKRRTQRRGCENKNLAAHNYLNGRRSIYQHQRTSRLIAFEAFSIISLTVTIRAASSEI